MIRKLRSGPNQYEARGREIGKQYKRRFVTKKLAEEFELAVRNREQRRRAGLPDEQGSVTYHELWEKFRLQHQALSKDWHEAMASYSLERFGHLPVRELRPEEIAKWHASLTLSAKTKKHILGAMRQVLELGVDWGYLARNPASRKLVKTPRSEPPDVRPFESWATVETIAKQAVGYTTLILFACATGLRPEEWIALTWTDIDFTLRSCRINKVVVHGQLRTTEGKTSGAFRTVMLPQRALDALQSLPRPINSDALIFPAARGGYINLDNWRSRVWKPALIAAGVEHRPLYQMRHTYATLGLAAGADIYWVSKQLGHTNIQTTLKHYARFLPAVDERNLKLLDEFAA
jgi:integrase